jgi:methyl-accepting chemotaxis protein
MLNRLSISSRLMLFTPVLFASLCVTVWFGLAELKNSMLEDRKESVKQLIQVAYGIVEGWHQKETSGQLSHEEAQQGARDALRRLRYADSNFIFVHQYDGVAMVQFSRDLEGQNRIDNLDPDGVPTVRRLIEAARRGGDFVSYRARRTGGGYGGTDASTLIPKVSYARGFDPWQWSIGTGIFIDDVNAAYARIAWVYGAIGAAVLALAILLAYRVE